MFPALPVARINVLRALIYLFVIFDVLVLVNGVVAHADTPADLERPLALQRAFGIPAPTPGWAQALRAFLVIGCAAAATGRAPRLLGGAIALGYLEWSLLAMSYGKVNHDHLALVTALFVLPTVPARGAQVFARRARRARSCSDSQADELAGWAIRCIQLAVVATYTLSVWAKIRHGGWDWAGGSTFLWAVERRGTFLGRPLIHVPELLMAAQWFVVALELAAPVVFVLRGRALAAVVAGYLTFHLITWATISIHFLPLVICWSAFAPLEKLTNRQFGLFGSSGPGRIPQTGPPPGSRLRLFAIKR
jgi:hypothetical protein